MTDLPAFQPVNELERVLLRAKGGWIPIAALFAEITRSEVVLLVDNEVGSEVVDATDAADVSEHGGAVQHRLGA